MFPDCYVLSWQRSWLRSMTIRNVALAVFPEMLFTMTYVDPSLRLVRCWKQCFLEHCSGQRSSLRGRGRLCSLSQNQGGVPFPPCVSRLPPSPTSPVLFLCAAPDLPFTPNQSTTAPDLSVVMGWVTFLCWKNNFQLKAIMGLDLLRLLPDIFLLCSGSLKSLDVLRVSRRYSGSSFSDWLHRLSPQWASPPRTGLAQAVFLLLHWPQLSPDCSDRTLLWGNHCAGSDRSCHEQCLIGTLRQLVQILWVLTSEFC